jgi:hypothetical protein
MNDFITTKEASRLYKVSQSSIKKIVTKIKVEGNEARYLKQGLLLNTGLYQSLISIDFLNNYYKKEPTRIEEPTEQQKDIISILKEELTSKQKVIDELLIAQKQFLINSEKALDNERNFQILLERANQRAELLESHFNRNKNLTSSAKDKEEEEAIEEQKNEPQTYFEEEETRIPSDRASFNEWLKRSNR